MYMLDTNICIYVINERDVALLDKFVLNAGVVCISSITYAELAYGVWHSKRVSQNELELAMFVKDLAVLAFDQVAGDHYGEVRATLAKRGELIGANDLLIAGHARSVDATLVTNNEREFRRIPRLSVENWLH